MSTVNNPGYCDFCHRHINTTFYQCDSSFNPTERQICVRCFLSTRTEDESSHDKHHQLDYITKEK